MENGSELGFGGADHQPAPVLNTLLCFLYHLVDNLLCRLDILQHQLDLPSFCKRATHVDQSTDIPHQPHLPLDGLFGVFLQFYIMRNLSLTCQFLSISSI